MSDLCLFLDCSQYALLLSYIQYCQHVLDPDLPTTVMQLLTTDEQENDDDPDLEKVLQVHWGNSPLDLPIVIFLQWCGEFLFHFLNSVPC